MNMIDIVDESLMTSYGKKIKRQTNKMKQTHMINTNRNLFKNF